MQETQEKQIRFPGWKYPQEEEMPTHSSILAWGTPWAEKPDGLQSTGLQRVRQDGACMHRAAGTGGGWKREHSCSKRQPLPPSFKLELKFKSETTVSHPNERPRAPRRAVCDPAGRRSTQWLKWTLRRMETKEGSSQPVPPSLLASSSGSAE